MARTVGGASALRAPDARALAERPLLRGVVHLCATLAAALGGVALLLVANSPAAYVGGAIFASSLVLMYGTSGLYHRLARRRSLSPLLRRLDHAMIFVLIAGTYTPFCLVVLERPWGISMLATIWGVAGAGILTKLVWPDLPRALGVGFYVGLGWLALVPAPVLAGELATGAVALLVVGGVLYTVGGVTYALGRPNPWPRVYGFHEVFHSLVVGGSALHYLVVAVYVLPR